jgi:hypothetical protein
MINNSEFILKEIPKFNPELDKWEHFEFWRDQITKSIEGAWAGGKWCPGPLYDYVNFAKIPIEDFLDGGSQKIERPLFRDNEWETHYIYQEAKGFSGFSKDEKYTCNRLLGPEGIGQEAVRDIMLERGILKPEDLTKEYIPAREYLRKLHSGDMGSPLYTNSARYVITGQARGGGKSVSAAGMAVHNFKFGGATNAEAFFRNLEEGTYSTSLTILSSAEAKWVAQLQTYVLDMLKYQPGDIEYRGRKYLSPMRVSYTGSKEMGDDSGLVTPTGSRLLTRLFSNNALSTNSGRPNLAIIDEALFIKNLSDVLAALKGSEASKLKNNLVVWMMGTGGLAKGNSVQYAEEIFYNPEKYNCLAFPDLHEGRGNIGYFVPIEKTKLLYKESENYITNMDLAISQEDAAIKAIGNNKRALEGHRVNSPRVPSDIFLVVDNSVFPTLEIKQQLHSLEGGAKSSLLEGSFKGWLKFTDNETLEFEVTTLDTPIRKYPFDGTDSEKKGAIEMWWPPVKSSSGEVDAQRYIIGVDVVDKAASTTDSLPSVIVYDRLMKRICAEYTGRTIKPSFFYEVVRKLSIFYNAKIMYEQNLVGLFTYFEQHTCLYRLADTPKSLRNSETWKEGTNTSKGINKAGTRIEDTGISFINEWLNTKTSELTDENKVSTINSPALLREFLKYQPTSVGRNRPNVDRISALIMVFWYDNTLSLIKDEKDDTKKVNTFLNNKYFIERGFLKDTN